LAIFSNPEKYGLQELSVDSAKRLLVRNAIQTDTYKTFFEYWMEKKSISNIDLFRDMPKHKFKPRSSLNQGMINLGSDAYSNYYWLADIAHEVIIFNEDGIVIDVIKFNRLNISITPAVHPS
jgi:hypothetical protein